VNKKIKSKLLKIPSSPGIYKFLDKSGKIMYIGKALNLNIRVNSYFRNDHFDRPNIIPMIPLIEDLEVVETASEIDALILESALIKKHKPHYNIDLKDDKSYAWIFISNKEKLPTVKIVRSIRKGEFKKGQLFGPYPKGLAVKRVYQYIRKIYPFCTCKSEREEKLYYEIGLCPGLLTGKISLADYRKQIGKIIKLLNGNIKSPINDLEKQMNYYAKNLDYEKAGVLRDKIDDLKYISQNIGVNPYQTETDYIEKRKNILKIEIEDLAIKLGVKSLKRIECYDISNISGTNAYGSMVVAINGEIDTSNYRIFKIKNENGPNDYEMLQEVLKRRFSSNNNWEEPNLVLIDGGKGQVESVKNIIPEGISLMGISKGRKYKRKGMKKRDEFWLYDALDNEIKQINIEKPDILIRLRDEAHRFAIRHYRKSKLKEVKKSFLDDIDGIGDKRKRLLLKSFPNLSEIKQADYETLNKIIKNSSVTKKIMSRFSSPEE